MTTAKTYPFIVFLFLCFIDAIKAQEIYRPENKYYTEHFGENEGLQQNSIMSILPDQNGFLWIATQAGITRFNGNRFIPTASIDSIKENWTRVNSLYYKGKDTILAYSPASRKVAIIVKNKIVATEEQEIQKHGLFFYGQHTIIPAPAYINGNNYNSPFAIKEKWNLDSHDFIGAMYNKDTFCVMRNDGIGIYDSKGPIGKILINDIIYNRVLFVNHQIIYIDGYNYVNFYSASGTLIKKISLEIPYKQKLIFYYNSWADNFYCITDADLYRINVTESTELKIQKLITNLQTPEDIRIVFEKDSNTVITGTDRNGLFIYRKKIFSTTNPLPDGKTDAFYGQILLPDDKTILSGKGELFRNNQFIDKTIKGFNNTVHSNLKDKKGNYWYAGFGGVLRSRDMEFPGDTILHTLNETPHIFLEDGNGRIWIGYGNQFGYIEQDNFIEVKIGNIPPWSVLCMRQDTTGKYLIGTQKGLFILRNYKEQIAQEIPAFKSYNVRFILNESNGLTWVCTYGNGLFLITKDGVTSFAEIDHRIAYVHSVIPDENGLFWMPTNTGLFAVTRQSLLNYSKDKRKLPFFYKISTRNGLRSNEFNGGEEPAYLRLPNGDISLATMKGLVNFNPSAINFNFSPSPILIDNIQLDTTEINTIDNLDIINNVQRISFTISSSFWDEGENEMLEYQVVQKNLDTKSDQWIIVDESGIINLFSPSNGDYQLIIRKRKGVNADDYNYKIINFHVQPKWYQTNTFSLLALLTLITIMIVILFFRRNYYRKINLTLKEKIDAATIELKQMNNTLEEKVKERTKEIGEAEKKFRTLAEKSLVGVYIVQDGRYVYVNPRYEQLSGYDAGELIGQNAEVLVKKDQRTIALENLRRRISGESDSAHYQITGVTKGGIEKQFEFFGNAIDYEGKRTIIGTMVDITERTKIENELREAEMKFRDLVEKSLVGVYIIKDGKLPYVNPRLAEIFGYTQREITEAPSINFIVHEDDREKVAFNVKQRIEGVLEEIHYEVRGIKKDGTIINIEVFGSPTLFEGDKAIIGTLLDITAKKIAQQQLIEEKDLSLSIINNLPGTFYVFDKEGRYQLWNKNFETITGYTAEEISKLDGRALTDEKDLADVGKAIEKIYAEGYGEVEARLLCKDGSAPFYYCNGIPINYNGKLCVMGVGIDISERKMAQLERENAIKALQKSEANLNTIFDITDTYYVLLDEAFRLITFNQSAIRFGENELGKKFSVNTSFPEYFAENRQAGITENLRMVLSGKPVSYETSYLYNDGNYSWYRVRMFPITNEEKVPFGIMIAGSDITEMKRLEQEILEQKVQDQKTMTRAILIGEERERNKIGQELHDNINQILVGTKLYLSMVTKDKPGSENIINESMRLLDNAIGEIRALSNGKVTPVKKVDLEELLQTLIDRFRVSTNINSSFIYKGAANFRGDDLKLNIYRIMQEQLNNISKHSQAKSINIVVEVGEENIRISVTDDGKGFVVNDKSDGIGISNMVSRVESFNGTIEIESSPGNGCKTEINLPV